MEAACQPSPSTAPTRAVLWAGLGNDLLLFRSNGTAARVPALPSPPSDPASKAPSLARKSTPAAGLSGFAQLVAQGGFVAASGLQGGAALADDQGNLLWQQGPHFKFGPIYLSDSGALAALVTERNPQGGFTIHGALVTASGEIVAMPPSAIPVGPPSPDGVVPVLVDDPTAPGAGWWRSDDKQLQRLSLPNAMRANGTLPQWSGDRAIYLATRDGAVVLASERPGEVHTITLAQLAVGHDGTLAEKDLEIAALSPNGWALLRDKGSLRLWRVHLASGQIEPVTGALPPGMRPLSLLPRAWLDPDGALLALLRDDFGGALFRSTDDGVHLDRVGAWISPLTDLQVESRNGTFLIRPAADRNAQPWPEPPADHEPPLSPALAQIVRPATRTLRTLPNPVGLAGTTLSQDGLCAAYWEPNAQEASLQLVLLDIEHGDHKALFATSQGSGVAAAIWVASPSESYGIKRTVDPTALKPPALSPLPAGNLGPLDTAQTPQPPASATAR